MSHWGALLLLGWCLLVSRPTEAQPNHDPSIAPFWRAAREPATRRAQALLRQGRALLYPTLGAGSLLSRLGRQRRTALDNALARFRRAQKLDPQNPELLFLTAEALSRWETELPSGLVRRRDGEAILQFEQLRRVDPDYEAYEVAYSLGTLYTRSEHFNRAAEEYRRAIAVHLDERIADVTANLAEVTMMGGDLDEAVHLYRLALDAAEGDERLLPMWGLSVALDRLGEKAAALKWAERANQEDRRPMAVLDSPGVFFVPEYERHYYTGLGHLAQASKELGRNLSDCHPPVSPDKAAERAEGTLLREIARTLDQLLELDGERASYQRLHARIHARLENQSRHRTKRQKRETDAAVSGLLHVLTSLRDYQRYLSFGGKDGLFGARAQEHVERTRHCAHL